MGGGEDHADPFRFLERLPRHSAPPEELFRQVGPERTRNFELLLASAIVP
jgi:hypothetical protein